MKYHFKNHCLPLLTEASIALRWSTFLVTPKGKEIIWCHQFKDWKNLVNDLFRFSHVSKTLGLSLVGAFLYDRNEKRDLTMREKGSPDPGPCLGTREVFSFPSRHAKNREMPGLELEASMWGGQSADSSSVCWRQGTLAPPARLAAVLPTKEACNKFTLDIHTHAQKIG